MMALRVAAFLVTIAADDGPSPWSCPSFPRDILFVKGKKVAGTTIGGVMRRIGANKGISFYSPEVPEQAKTSGRERWILDDFVKFEQSHNSFVGWAQEQTLSPMRAGLGDTSKALEALAERALRVTVVREPVAHALSACTHFGPCATKTKGNKIFTNVTVAARKDWILKSMGPAQMWRFITPWPSEVLRKGSFTASLEERRNATKRLAEYYHVILLADDVDRSLVAMASVIPGIQLTDVLYLAAKTTHTGRRPPVEPQPPDFLHHLDRLFYGAPDLSDASSGASSSSSSSDDVLFAPDTDLYFWATARLRATIDKIGHRRFDRDLVRFQRMQARMLAACTAGKKHQRRLETDLEDTIPPRLPTGITPRTARECLYGDQGCGFKCIDAWVRDHTTLLRSPRQQQFRHPRRKGRGDFRKSSSQNWGDPT